MLSLGFLRKRARHSARHLEDKEGSIASQWREVFLRRRDSLSAVASILTDGPCSPAIVLIKAESKIQDRYVCVEFRYRFAIRAVVLAALEIPALNQCHDGIELFDCRMPELIHFRERMAALPITERRVVLLRDVLEYGRREISLLLNTSDTRVDELLCFGRKRLVLDGPAGVDCIKAHFASIAATTTSASWMGPFVTKDGSLRETLLEICL